MAVIRIIRKPRAVRSFHTLSAQRASVLFALGALSNSRETQHFNKLSHLSRVEHSPNLKLIKTSEIDPFPLPTPEKRLIPVSLRTRPRAAAKIWDDKALQVGRAILANNAKQMYRMRSALAKAKKGQTTADQAMQRSLADWAKERQRLNGDIRQAAVLMIIAIGTATGLAMWRFWPQNEAARDSGELGRKIAERAKRAIPLPAAKSAAGDVVVAPAVSIAPLPAVRQGPTPILPVNAAQPSVDQSSWWQNLFWKRS